ncbi:hypothetical protein GQ54DRAFT_337074 [Martensiomyces pterosporus]|nr:hypothetical protein GQ54DRAFT_337074 [Martensiomyces pterosporus]
MRHSFGCSSSEKTPLPLLPAASHHPVSHTDSGPSKHHHRLRDLRWLRKPWSTSTQVPEKPTSHPASTANNSAKHHPRDKGCAHNIARENNGRLLAQDDSKARIVWPSTNGRVAAAMGIVDGAKPGRGRRLALKMAQRAASVTRKLSLGKAPDGLLSVCQQRNGDAAGVRTQSGGALVCEGFRRQTSNDGKGQIESIYQALASPPADVCDSLAFGPSDTVVVAKEAEALRHRIVSLDRRAHGRRPRETARLQSTVPMADQTSRHISHASDTTTQSKRRLRRLLQIFPDSSSIAAAAVSSSTASLHAAAKGEGCLRDFACTLDHAGVRWYGRMFVSGSCLYFSGTGLLLTASSNRSTSQQGYETTSSGPPPSGGWWSSSYQQIPPRPVSPASNSSTMSGVSAGSDGLLGRTRRPPLPFVASLGLPDRPASPTCSFFSAPNAAAMENAGGLKPWRRTAIKIPLHEVTRVSKELTMGLWPNAITVATGYRHYIFTNFLRRDRAYQCIHHSWTQALRAPPRRAPTYQRMADSPREHRPSSPVDAPMGERGGGPCASIFMHGARHSCQAEAQSHMSRCRTNCSHRESVACESEATVCEPPHPVICTSSSPVQAKEPPARLKPVLDILVCCERPEALKIFPLSVNNGHSFMFFAITLMVFCCISFFTFI